MPVRLNNASAFAWRRSSRSVGPMMAAGACTATGAAATTVPAGTHFAATAADAAIGAAILGATRSGRIVIVPVRAYNAAAFSMRRISSAVNGTGSFL
jgi:hypothetical protein